MSQSQTENSTPLAAFQAMLDRYRAIRFAPDEAEQAQAFIHGFTRLCEQYKEIRQASEVRQLREAPEYNIFSILRVERDEVRTHSAFLCHLLTPTASHGQGMLFLRTFLEYCAGRHNEKGFPDLPNFNGPPRSWLVTSETTIDTGRLDIIILNPQEGFLCVVENKVDAAEGWDQLSRYSRWMDAHHRQYPIQALCFLTRTGEYSRTAGDRLHFPLSYHEDIAGWLETVLDQIQASEVRAVVHQYQAIAACL